MVKSIDEVLTLSELGELRHIEGVLGDLSKAHILENVSHIECSVKEGVISVTLYHSLVNPYLYVSHRKKENYPVTTDLIKNIRSRYAQFSADRQRILLNELRLRTHDVEEHKWFLSERMGYNVGLVVASAHWLRDISTAFYAQSKEHCQAHDIDFEWSGMEKSIVIQAIHEGDAYSHCVLVLRSDIMLEENMAQGSGGVIGPTATKTYVRAKAARAQLTAMYAAEHVYILDK